jgi:hypothetical protein
MMGLINLEKVLLVSLWKSSVEEIIQNKHFNFVSDFVKIALILKEQKIPKDKLKRLEENQWLIIEVESILKDATSQELEDYLKSHFDEIDRSIKELKIINPDGVNYSPKIKIEKESDSIDSFLNEQQ